MNSAEKSNPTGLRENAPDPRRWIAMSVVLLATFMVLLDVTIVIVAVPSFQRDLHATYAEVQLVVALYLIAYAVCLITGGRLGDLFGRKRVFMIGVTGFTATSSLCGMAPTPELLLGARVLQGIAAALMYPQALSYAQVLFRPEERNRVFAIFGAVIGLASLSGQLLGGALIQWNLFALDWRLIFLVNIPVGIAALAGAALLLHESREAQAKRLDLGGVALISAALLLLVWPLVEGREAGWPLWAPVALAAALPAFAIVAVFERRLSARGGAPVIDPGLFRHRTFTLGLLTVLALLAGIPSFVLTFALYLQVGLGFSALRSGLTTAPFMAGFLFGAIASARLIRRFGVTTLVAGGAVMVFGMGLTMLSIDRAGTGLQGWELSPALLITGLGGGTVVSQIFRVVVSKVPLREAGAASGVLATVHQVGNTLGIAVIGVIFFGFLGNHAASVAATAAPGLQQRLVSAGVPAWRTAGMVNGFRVCFHDRAVASDPTATPASCQRSAGTTVTRAIFSEAGRSALATDMHDGIVVALRFNIAVWALALVLLVSLSRALRSEARADPAAAPLMVSGAAQRVTGENELPSVS
ncbi:MAG: MFS transporter [Candidatus Dormibacteria bacterium]